MLTLLYVGSHADADRWIEQNRGLTFVIDKETKRVAVVAEVSARDPLPPRQLNFELPIQRALVDLLGQEALKSATSTAWGNAQLNQAHGCLW